MKYVYIAFGLSMMVAAHSAAADTVVAPIASNSVQAVPIVAHHVPNHYANDKSNRTRQARKKSDQRVTRV